ncbi:DUF397 domain-containing protein [Actinoplanes sp. HUAS TT8]|uniref:DUF397 domain-containing protein n=1 Tax=Actinoplanes sp. HUAS TT8 TaxID=3447453 RepID=UPI003F51C341
MNDTTTGWYKSSFCESSSCLEAASAGEHILVRNNTQPGERHLQIDRGGWNVFLDDIVKGRFSNL